MTVSVDIATSIKHLNNIQRKQIPFATSKALNQTAFDSIKTLSKQTLTKIDTPTKFTQKAFQVKKSKKTNLIAKVFIKPIQAKYFKYLIWGGTRTASGRRLNVPSTNTRLNKFGNIPRTRVPKLLQDSKHFSGIPKGRSGQDSAGIWKRGGKNIKMVIAFQQSTSYDPGRFPFHDIVKGVVNRKFKKNFDGSLKQALRTAK
tara:strand:+ start:4018 stop:4620 length:603 start_codon:yes stop_codon:yes gene_type:complete